MSTLLAVQATKVTEKGKESTLAGFKDKKSKFSKHMIAALCGYCKVTSPEDIPDIWPEFEKHTTPASWQSDLMVVMQELAKANKVGPRMGSHSGGWQQVEMSRGVTAIVLSTSKNLSADVVQLVWVPHIMPEQKTQS